MIDTKPLRIKFGKIEEFIRIYAENSYLLLLASEKYDFTYNRIAYLIGVKSGISFAVSYNYAQIKVDSYNSLPLEKTMSFHKVIILIKSVFNKDKNTTTIIYS